MRRRTVLLLLGSLAVVAVVTGLLVFKPWLLFVDVRVDDAIPTTSATATPIPGATSTAPPASPVQLSAGGFVSQEHETSGTARIIRNADGTLVLAIEGLDTSNGPDVHVWLSAADAVEGPGGWYLAGGAAYLDLGPLKGNLGDQLYDIPAGTDLTTFHSVSLWCVQFSVGFGAAQLA
jgi:Electron transfer DM13